MYKPFRVFHNSETAYWKLKSTLIFHTLQLAWNLQTKFWIKLFTWRWRYHWSLSRLWKVAEMLETWNLHQLYIYISHEDLQSFKLVTCIVYKLQKMPTSQSQDLHVVFTSNFHQGWLLRRAIDYHKFEFDQEATYHIFYISENAYNRLLCKIRTSHYD